MNLNEAYKLAIKEISLLREYAKHNANHMDVIWYKQKLENDAIEYNEAIRLLKQEMEKNEKGILK